MIRDLLTEALQDVIESLEIAPRPTVISLERPARLDHGDWSSNVAMTMAKSAGQPPRALATAIVEKLNAKPAGLAVLQIVQSVEVAGPGFINFRLDPAWLHDVVRSVLEQGTESFGRVNTGDGKSICLEFVSANPTGPLHVGNAWWSSHGDALARVLQRTGWRVQREYYVNDTGNQIRVLGASVIARRRGEEPPEGGYQGEYISEVAKTYDGPDDEAAAGRQAAAQILGWIRKSMESINIHFDEWFSQASIEESGKVQELIEYLRGRGMIYEKDGATWLRSAELGAERDRVLVKSAEKGGFYTYLAGDLAYHYDKLVTRGFDRALDIFGADHHGQVASLLASVEAMGIDRDRLEIKLGQMISLTSGKMSKRTGNFVTLDEVVSDIGSDAFRLLSLVNSIDQSTTVDLDLIKQNSAENPVFYVQYAHARISSIFRKAAERGMVLLPAAEVDLTMLQHERELHLMRALEELPDVIASAADLRAPHRVTTWALDFAGRFHSFYHDCRVLGVDVNPELSQARLVLTEACRIGFDISLALLGVRAPEQMQRHELDEDELS